MPLLRQQHPRARRVDYGIAVDVDYAKEVGCTQERPGKLLLAAWRAVCIAYLWTDQHY